MIINTSEIGKVLPINLFKNNKLYSFDDGMNLIIVNELTTNFENQEFALDSKSLELIKKFENPDIELVDNEVIIKDNNKKYKVKTINASLPDFNSQNLIGIRVKLEDLRTARKFTSNSATRPILTSVNVNQNGNIYATNSYIAYIHKGNENSDNVVSSVNIPNTFIDILDIDTEVVDIKFNEFNIYVMTENRLFISRVIMGNFPNIEKLTRIITSQQDIIFDYNELKEAITFASYVGKAKEYNSNIICKFNNSKLTCNGLNDFECDIACNYNDNDYNFNMSIDYAQLMVNTCNNVNDDNELVIKYTSPTSPLIVIQDNNTFMFTPIRG